MITDPLQFNSQAGASRRGTALIVDRDDKDLHSYAEVLCRMGFEVKTFLDFGEAARCLEHETADFVLVSQGSPAFEGQGVVQQALAQDRHTPVIVVAPHLDLGCYLEAIQLGAADYLEKPLSPDDVEYLVTTFWRPHVLKMSSSA